jgi:hypothetical protein
MNRLPDRQIDVDNPPRLGRIRRPRDGHVKTLTARVGGDEAELPQEFLQVADEAWSIDDDVQAAVALRSCRNEVAFSHCRDEAAPVKSSQHDVDEQEQGSRRTFSRKRACLGTPRHSHISQSVTKKRVTGSPPTPSRTFSRAFDSLARSGFWVRSRSLSPNPWMPRRRTREASWSASCARSSSSSPRPSCRLRTSACSRG